MAPAVSPRKVTVFGRYLVRYLGQLSMLTAHSFILALVILDRYPRKFPSEQRPQMPNRRMNADRRMNARPVPGDVSGWSILAFVALVVTVSGCSTAQIDSIPQEIGGLPAGAPARSAEPPSYPAVHDMPPPRAAVLDAEQQKKLEADLIAIRNRQPNQQKNIAREKAKAEKAAKAKAAKENRDQSGRDKKKVRKPPEQTAGQPASQGAVAGQAPSGTPPWPLPPQTTGGSRRP